MMGGYHQVILPSDTDMIGNEGLDTSTSNIYTTNSVSGTGGNCLCPHTLLRRDINSEFP